MVVDSTLIISKSHMIEMIIDQIEGEFILTELKEESNRKSSYAIVNRQVVKLLILMNVIC